ncbi:MAG: Glucosamine-6-phosphate deaminase family protein [Capsulimonas sp.]|jgi:glucosamine-6-phosphate deaminase|nr:Glucosamine-6-phosphate deaminase family protein [Capsulimonas sp.]
MSIIVRFPPKKVTPVSNTCLAEVGVFAAPDYAALCNHVADLIAALIQSKPDAVLGLATGATPLGVYAALARRHREEGLDFSRVTSFNLDEYYPMSPRSLRSYRQFMAMNLFDYVNCQHWSVPDGRPTSIAQIAMTCRDYEQAIHDAGGLDLQLLGVGRTGHMGFNEPGSSLHSRTRLVTLAPVTRQDAALGFGGIENVPTQAITMGVGTIMEARQIVMMASGSAKSEIVHRVLTDEISDQLPASFMRLHENAVLCVDEAAGRMIL